ncbi:uncharacterized protein AB675_3080 [Cyphellophora attinorum]|uniref:Uncharacterized protein n=1 Tax=Cyphellophora attinorum TaxID=1664694 RepID=A0A0N1H5U6_9EURO|nr:uncharacterized protein AB675_3080 [Phialophora attinorum]KPI37882.1 hypothetical protein AB675_3080 [Phialophora attinorum]
MADPDSSTRTKILLLGDIEFAKDKWSSLASTHEVITPKSTDRASFIAECQSGALDGVTGIYRTFPSITTTGRFDTASSPLSLPRSSSSPTAAPATTTSTPPPAQIAAYW